MLEPVEFPSEVLPATHHSQWFIPTIRLLASAHIVHFALSISSRLRLMLGIGCSTMGRLGTVLVIAFSPALVGMVTVDDAQLARICGLETLSSSRSKMRSSHWCTNISSMSILLFLFVTIVLHARIIKDFLLPWCCPEYWAKATEEKRRKITSQILAMVIRFASLVVLIPTMFTNYTTDGIRFRARNHFMDRCNVDEFDAQNVAGLWSGTVWLITLLVWEMGYIPNLQWDDWAHHILTSFVLGYLIDENATLSPLPNAGTIDAIPAAVVGVHYFMLLGASVAAFNYLLLLMYHFSCNNPIRQGMVMGMAAVFSWGWQVPLFLWMPLQLLWSNTNQLNSETLAFFTLFATGMFVIDSKCNVVRLQVMKRKLSQVFT